MTAPTICLRARLARVRDKNILFSLPQSGIFELNDTSADIWEALEEGRPATAIVAEMVSRGISEEEASVHLASALDQWERLGLVHPAPRPVSPPAPPGVRQVLSIAGLGIGIDYATVIGPPVRAVFRHLESLGAIPQVLLRVQDGGARIHLFRGNAWRLSCAADELPTMLKGALLTEVLHGVPYEIALHAAAVVRDERLMLLFGPPGAGKTTLTLALLRAKFGFAGDDVTLLDDRGRATGLPFPPAVKSGAWPILSELVPDLRKAPVFRRPDRRRVRYPVPQDLPAVAAREIGWIVLLNRSDAGAHLEAIDAAEALRGLLAEAYAATSRLSESGVEVLVDLLRSAQACRLTYGRLDDAVQLLSAMADHACSCRV